MKLGAHDPNRRRSASCGQIMAKRSFTAESQFLRNWMLTAQIGEEALLAVRSWQNEGLRPNRNFYEIGCLRPKSPELAQKRFPRSDHGKMNFYGRIAIFMKLHWVLKAQIGTKALPEVRSCQNEFLRPNRNFYEIGCSRPRSAQKHFPRSDHAKMTFYGRIGIGNWMLTAQIGEEALLEVNSWLNEVLRPNRNFYEIGCSRPKSAQKRFPWSDRGKMNFYGRIAIFMKLGAHGRNRRRSPFRVEIMAKRIFTTESQVL